MSRREPYMRSVSTTHVHEIVKISLPPKATGDARRSADIPALKRLARSDGPFTLTFISRGGAEWWWEVRARGHVWRVEYTQSVGDLLLDILDGTGGQ